MCNDDDAPMVVKNTCVLLLLSIPGGLKFYLRLSTQSLVPGNLVPSKSVYAPRPKELSFQLQRNWF